METHQAVELQKMEVFQDVPEASLQWFWDQSEVRLFKAGDNFMKPGTPIDYTLVILEGRFRMNLKNGKQMETIVIEQGSVTGYLPFSRLQVVKGVAVIAQDVTALVFPRAKMREMIHDHYELTEALVHQMTSRVRDFTNRAQLNDKMIALGKLSAGLAHELNNPAAAIARSSASLRDHLERIPKGIKKIMALKKINPGVAEQLVTLLNSKYGARQDFKLGPLERSYKEDDYTAYLDDLGVAEADRVAESLVDFSFSEVDLDHLKNIVDPADYSAVFSWISDSLNTRKMVDEISEASIRISDLVKSVKVFTHMDRSNDKQKADIHEGIRNTLTMLQYRLHKGNVELVEDFDLSLPQVFIFGGEMNQVWTNLIDNALDAMESNGSGKLTIQTHLDLPFVRINIIDNGLGIPQEIADNVYEPFFTTKEVGKGTGLGLESALSIIKKHNGSLKFKSKPGLTDFEICLPLDS